MKGKIKKKKGKSMFGEIKNNDYYHVVSVKLN